MKFLIFLIITLILLSFTLSNFKISADNFEHDIFINEFLPDAEGSDSGKEWLELYNASNSDVNLKDWKISTKTTSTPRNTVLPDVVIKSHNFLVISEFEIIGEYSYVNVGTGKLNLYNSNAEIYLSNSNNLKVDSILYINTQEGKSLERRGPISSDYCNLLQQGNNNTMGQVNTNIDISCWYPSSYPDNSGDDSSDNNEVDNNDSTGTHESNEPNNQESIIITEVFPSPDKDENEWIEIYNQDISEVDVTGMYLKERAGDGSISSTKTLLPSRILSPKEYMVIDQDNLKLTLNNSGDQIYLFDANDTIVDNFSYLLTPTSISISRKFDGYQYIKKYNEDMLNNFVPQTTIATPGKVNQFEEIPVVNIGDVSKYLNKTITTQGIVNSELNYISKSNFYIQDNTGGSRVHINFHLNNLKVEFFNKLDVTAKVKTNGSEYYLDLEKQDNLKILSDLPEVLSSVKSDYINLNNLNVNNFKDNINMLVTFEGTLTKNYGSSFYLSVEDTNLPAVKVKIPTASNIELPDKTTGDLIRVSGLLVKDGDQLTIIPNYPTDITNFKNIDELKVKNTQKGIESSTLSSNILGKNTTLNSSNKNLDHLYLDMSSNGEEKNTSILPWPVYLISSIFSVLEFLKTVVGIKSWI